MSQGNPASGSMTGRQQYLSLHWWPSAILHRRVQRMPPLKQLPRTYLRVMGYNPGAVTEALTFKP
jgi:hypothetical protein